MRHLPLSLVVVAVGARTVGADARYPRTQETPVSEGLSERVKAPPAPPAGAVAVAAKPSVDVATVLAVQSPMESMRPEQEQILVQLIENTPDSEREEKEDYYFRLASLYAMQVRVHYQRAAELTAANAANPAAATQAELGRVSDLGKTNLLKAVKVFKGLTDNDAFRDYPKLDVALFEYGYTLQTGKYMKEARAVYDKLLKNFPNSAYVPFAHLVFAEYYVEANQLSDAEARYRMVLKFPKSAAYWFAMYKVGWILMQQQHHQDALEMFAQIVFATRSDAKQRTIYEAARRDFVAAYAKIGKIDKAYDAFTRLDKDGAAELVQALADAAELRGELPAAIGAYRQLLARSPKDRRACLWQYKIAHATLWLPGVAAVDRVREIETLVSSYARQHAEAAAAGTPDDDQCRQDASAMAGELAAAFHAEWSKTRTVETLALSERLYTAYVGAGFPDSEPQRAALDEVLWSHAVIETDPKLRAERWERTAAAFAQDGTEDGERAAALAWLNAYDYAAPTAATLTIAKRPRAAAREQAIKGRDDKLVTTLTAYLARDSATDDEAAQMRLLVATTLRKYHHFDAATDVLDQFLAKHPEHASAELAALMLLDSMVQAKSDDLPIVVSAMLADQSFVAGKVHLLAALGSLRAVESHRPSVTAASSR